MFPHNSNPHPQAADHWCPDSGWRVPAAPHLHHVQLLCWEGLRPLLNGGPVPRPVSCLCRQRRGAQWQCPLAAEGDIMPTWQAALSVTSRAGSRLSNFAAT